MTMGSFYLVEKICAGCCVIWMSWLFVLATKMDPNIRTNVCWYSRYKIIFQYRFYSMERAAIFKYAISKIFFFLMINNIFIPWLFPWEQWTKKKRSHLLAALSEKFSLMQRFVTWVKTSFSLLAELKKHFRRFRWNSNIKDIISAHVIIIANRMI